MHVLDFGARSDRGAVRPINEDSILAAPPVFVVADGVGGSQAGEVASAIVVEEFSRLITPGVSAANTVAGRVGAVGSHPGSTAGMTGPAAIDPDQIRDALVAAQERVLTLHGQGAQGAGSTAAGAVGVMSGNEPYWVVFNIGDSRIYRLLPPDWDDEAPASQQPGPVHDPDPGARRRGRLRQISVDHSHVQEMVEAGLITSKEAENHPSSNVVTRAVGAPGGFAPDFWMLPMVPGDRLLICSDGLTSEIATETITEVISAGGSPADTATELLRVTLQAGARDNVSVIVVDALPRCWGNARDG